MVTSCMGNLSISSSVGVLISNPEVTPQNLKLMNVSSVSSIWNTSPNFDEVLCWTVVLYTLVPYQQA